MRKYFFSPRPTARVSESRFPMHIIQSALPMRTTTAKESLIVQLFREKNHWVGFGIPVTFSHGLFTHARRRTWLAARTPSALRNRAQLCDTGP
ncbi:hypothetical protein CDAR_280971 [Caerostris darwini]|uniref:Uncharacterized protein n=1 Tax=Caerostris darwini TaxID=1538125 RepID=A0AAV4VA10_9ARAC|nr:hypothetical protein CDAR_280971 [Caerostris darwini]